MLDVRGGSRRWVLFGLAVVSLVAARPAGATMPPLHGGLPPQVIQAFKDGLFRLDPVSTGPRTSLSLNTWRIPVIMVSFADDTVRYTPRDIERMAFDTTGALPNGSVAEYWRTVSGGRLHITGRVVANVRLPYPKSYYAANNSGLNSYGTPNNDLGYARDALGLCQQAVGWNEFDLDLDGYVDMLWVVHAGVGGEGGDRNSLWSITSRMATEWQGGSPYPTSSLVPGTARPVLIDRFTVLPELSLFQPGGLTEIGVYAHEFGHALGLPDLYDVTSPSDTGPGNWSLMSSGAYGGDGHSPDVPTLLGAWPMRYLGWDHSVRPAADTTLTLGPFERSPDIVDFWFQGAQAPEHFLIENRQPIGYDRNLPGSGLVVYRVDESIIAFGIANNRINSVADQGLVLLEADGARSLTTGADRGDAGDPFPGSAGVMGFDDFTHPSTRPIDGTLANIALGGIAHAGENMTVHLQVRPPGWQPAQDWTGASYAPASTRTPARAAGREPSGIADVATCETINGHSQIVLRSSPVWSAAQVMSQSPGAALDPSLAFLPNGDLALVWSDSRNGRFEIYYRARIRGSWTAERPIVSLAGSCRAPSIAADGRGGLALAFQYQSGDTVDIRFERFNYVVPLGQPIVASAGSVRPDSPDVLLGADGHGYLLWSDRHTAGTIWFATFEPDSGLHLPQPLTSWSSAHTSYVATIDSAGALYAMWSVSGPGINELRYHGRNTATPEEAVIADLASPLESMALEVDSQGSKHAAYSVTNGANFSLRYRRGWPGDAWDSESTDLSYPGSTNGSQPRLLPLRDGNVDIVYTARTPSPRFMVRSRILTPPAPTLTAVTAAVADVHVVPNPACAGAALTLWSADTGPARPETIEVYDAAGRRVALRAERWDGARVAAVLDRATTAGWPDGVYFARRRGSAAPAQRFVIVR